MLPTGSRGLHAAACGDVPPPGGGGKRGQDTKVSYPLLRLPNFPLRRSAKHSRLKMRGEHGFYLCALLFLYAIALRLRDLPRMTVRGQRGYGRYPR